MKIPAPLAPLVLLALAGILSGACRTAPSPSPAAAEPGRAIVVAGQRVPLGAPVVLWTEPGGYGASSGEHASAGELGGGEPRGEARHTAGRVPRAPDPAATAAVPPESTDLGLLARAVDLLVLHHAPSGTVRRAFHQRHEERRGSVHFLIDVDGTIYQTLDVRDTARHAGSADPRSVGVELAGTGAYRPREAGALDAWYERDEHGLRLALSADPGRTGVRSAGFVGRPRRGRVVGQVNGRTLEMVDFTPEQYDSLVELTAALVRALPRLHPDAPRDARGFVRTDALGEGELAIYRGLLGHCHLSERESDPGPAFDWEAYVRAVRHALARRP